MGKVMMGWVNAADSGTITASDAVGTLPASNLQDPTVMKKWRTSGGAPATSPYLILDCGSATVVRILALIGCNLTATATMQLRASNTDATVTSSLLYDSGVVAAGVDTRYKQLVHLLPAETSARYWRLDLSETTGLDYYEAGRLFLGPVWQPEVNYSYGWNKGWVDLSKRTKSRGGQTYVDEYPQLRTVTVNFDFLSQDEAEDGLLELDRVVGFRKDALLLLDDESGNLGRDTYWGLLTSLDPVVNPDVQLFRKGVSIEERL